MDDFTKFLDALSSAIAALGITPADLVGLHKKLPLPLAGGLVGFGLLACLFGSGKAAFRAVLAAPAVGIGFFLLGPHVSALLHLSKATGAYVAAGGLGALALAYPPALLGLCAGALGGLLGSELVEKADFWLGFVPGFLVAATLALLANRFLSIVISGLVGAAGLSLGGLALLSATPFAGLATSSPAIALAAFGCLALGSIAYQLKFAPTEDELAKRRADKQRRKQLTIDAKERDKRLKSYGKPKK